MKIFFILFLLVHTLNKSKVILMKTFSGESANEVWTQAHRSLLSADATHQDSRMGGTRELMKACFEILNPTQRWIWSRQPPLNVAFSIAEFLWVMAGRDDGAFLTRWFPGLSKFAGNGPKYHGAYGHRIRRRLGIDQLGRAYNTLRHNPDSRQVVLQIWDSSTDMPNENGMPVDADIPCNLTAMIKIRNGKLEWTQIARSNDIHRGVPTNFVQFTSIQEVLAGWLGIDVGSYLHFSDSLHLYLKDLNTEISPPTVPVPKNLDSLLLPKRESDAVFTEIERAIESLVLLDSGARNVAKLVKGVDLPPAYRNLFAVLAAEQLRQSQSLLGRQVIAEHCSNECLKELWKRWADSKVVQPNV